MTLNFIDTNIVLDIIYEKRNYNSKAINFYKQFKNYELSIENVVKKECFKVVNNKSIDFAGDLMDYINTQKIDQTCWNNMKIESRQAFLNDFVNNKNYRKCDENKPFYSNMINKIHDEIMYLNIDDFSGYLLDLTSKMQEYMNIELNARFIERYPGYDISKNVLPPIILKLKAFLIQNAYFKTNQEKDMGIFINLVHLVNFGEYKDDPVDSIKFYTMDSTFIKNFGKLQKCEINSPNRELTEYLQNGINNISFISPY